MNILLYIFALLTAMTIITYARIQTTLNTVGLRTEYANFIQDKERIEINVLQQKQYEKHKRTGKSNDNKKIQASSYLNFTVFTNKEKREANQEYFKNVYNITLRLIEILYSNEEFYQKFSEEYGSPPEILLNQILSLSNENPITNTDDLKALDLQNPALQELFAKMLEGGDDFASQEKKGYRSLLDFINIQSNVEPIRIQRIPPELLRAIYVDQEMTNEILQKREELRSQTGIIDSSKQQVASNTFESLYKSKLPKNLNRDYFNFSITKANPRK